MKKIFASLTLLAAAALVPLALCSCASSHDNHEQASSTHGDAQKLKVKFDALSVQIQTTSATLLALVDNPTAEPEKRFSVFSEAVDKTVSFAKDAQSVSTSLQEQSKKTVGQWSASIAEIQDEGLRRSAQESKEEYNKSFEESRSSSDNAFKKAEIYISKIEDARRSLKVNLSVDGIKNLKSFAKTTETSGTEAVSALKSAGDLAVKATARIAPASTVAGKK